MTRDDADLVAAQADLCRFLSACFYEPAAEFGEESLFDSMQAAAACIAPDLAAAARRLGEAFAADDLQTLLIDYTRLFLGPTQPLARPYGSFWLSGETTLMQQATLDVVDQYRLGGFDIDAAFHELPDHVAVELEYLYLLEFRRHQALRNAAAQDLAAIEDLRSQFLARHLGAWVGPFTDAVRAGAQTAFYRELAALTQSVVERQCACRCR